MNPFKILSFAGALMTASVAAAATSGEEIPSLYLYHNNSVIYAVEAAQVDSIAWEENGARVSLYDAEGTQLFTSGIERVDSLSTNLHTPKADILDVVFNEDGTATDISPMANEIRTFASDRLKTTIPHTADMPHISTTPGQAPLQVTTASTTRTTIPSRKRLRTAIRSK